MSYAESDADTNSDSTCNRDADSNVNSDSDLNTNSDTDRSACREHIGQCFLLHEPVGPGGSNRNVGPNR